MKIIPSKQHAAASSINKARYHFRNGVAMPDMMQRDVIAIEDGTLPLLMKYSMQHNFPEARYEFSKVFRSYHLHPEMNAFRETEEFTDAFYVSYVEHKPLYNRINDSGFGKGTMFILNTVTLQAQNGLGDVLEGSEFEQLIGPRCIALLNQLQEKRKSKLGIVHLATGRA